MQLFAKDLKLCEPSNFAKFAISTAWLALILPWLHSSSSLVTNAEPPTPFWQGRFSEEGVAFSFASCHPLNLLGAFSIPPFGKVVASTPWVTT